MDNFRRMEEALLEVDTPVKKLLKNSDVQKSDNRETSDVKQENKNIAKEGSERIFGEKPDFLQTKHTNCPQCGSVLSTS